MTQYLFRISITLPRIKNLKIHNMLFIVVVLTAYKTLWSPNVVFILFERLACFMVKLALKTEPKLQKFSIGY